MMATGMPVVSTNHCDIPNVVNYDIQDWLVDEKDVDGLANRITQLITDPGSWEQMLYKGRLHVEKYFNIKSQSKLITDIYNQIASN